MSPFAERDPALDVFSGVAPLFPLSSVVLFPQALLPLHIFEPRYRAMTADALAGEQLIAMAMPTENVSDRPAIRSIVGLGKIVAHERLPDGRYHLVLRGITRAKVQRELPLNLLYRQAELELLGDQRTPETDVYRVGQQLLATFASTFPRVQQHPLWPAMSESAVPLGAMCDLLISTLPLSPLVAQSLLEELQVEARVRQLTEILATFQATSASAPLSYHSNADVKSKATVTAADDPEAGAAAARPRVFPPRFSSN